MTSGNYRAFGAKHSSINESDQPLRENSPFEAVPTEEKLPPPYVNLEGPVSFLCECGEKPLCEICSVRLYMSRLLNTSTPTVEKRLRMSLEQIDGNFLRNDPASLELRLGSYNRNYYVVERRTNACNCKPKKWNQFSSRLIYECEEMADCSGLLCSLVFMETKSIFSKHLIKTSRIS